MKTTKRGFLKRLAGIAAATTVVAAHPITAKPSKADIEKRRRDEAMTVYAYCKYEDA